ncbi:hypothetical protein [Rhizosphaericola mali]|uniref:Lipoprotein n=1 Tax=Rhizosphaericola mali TaxID=2545455 RepID=A0A5P2G5R9_9BACT|nr:hypothetical protein [Rhizosphaericola mali]QES88473.1 hypothetical protein E0W69_007285 [Rhizosphaericola mali]
MRKVLFSIGILVAFSSCNYVDDVFVTLEKQIQSKISLQNLFSEPDRSERLDNNKLIQLNIPTSVSTSDSTSTKNSNIDMFSQFFMEKLGF